MDFETDFSSTRNGLVENPLSAPVDIRKQLSVGVFHPNQVVAAVVRRAEHNTLRSALQGIDCLAERLCRHRRTVRINQTTRLKTDPQQIFGRE